MKDNVSRRDLLKAAGVAGAAATVPAAAHSAGQHLAQAPGHGDHASHAASAGNSAKPNATQQGVLFFFNDEEGRFIKAAIDRLIPADPDWPGAAEAGVLEFIDRQLAGAFGTGARMYLKGPWAENAPPQQGYQLRFTPAELYRIGIEETRANVRDANNGREFWDLDTTALDQVLKDLESGTIQLSSLPSPVFFETLLANCIEGFFADPAYGGNRDMVGWRMVGFPGAYAQFLDLVDVYDMPYTRKPIGMADQEARHAHISTHHAK
jgi:gluconate 2-dehydrogenase gamma chain